MKVLVINAGMRFCDFRNRCLSKHMPHWKEQGKINMSHFSIISELYNLCNNFFSAYWPLRDTNPRNAFSTCFRGSIIWWPHPVQRMRISIPTRLSSHAFVPHGCDFFILITSPTFKSIHSLLIVTSTTTIIFYPTSGKIDTHYHLLTGIRHIPITKS